MRCLKIDKNQSLRGTVITVGDQCNQVGASKFSQEDWFRALANDDTKLAKQLCEEQITVPDSVIVDSLSYGKEKEISKTLFVYNCDVHERAILIKIDTYGFLDDLITDLLDTNALTKKEEKLIYNESILPDLYDLFEEGRLYLSRHLHGPEEPWGLLVDVYNSYRTNFEDVKKTNNLFREFLHHLDKPADLVSEKFNYEFLGEFVTGWLWENKNCASTKFVMSLLNNELTTEQKNKLDNFLATMERWPVMRPYLTFN